MANKRTALASKKKELHLQNKCLVCPSCAARNFPDADFCRSCGAPLGDTATVDPETSVRPAPWRRRRASSKPLRLITVVEWWLGLGPCLIVFPYFLAQQLADSTEIGVYEVMELLVGFLFLVLSGAVLYRITVNYWSRPKQR